MTPQETIEKLNRIQLEHNEWELANFGPQPLHRPLWGMAEEAGEFYHALLKREQKIRLHENHDAAIVDAFGDIGIYAISFANKLGLKLTDAVIECGCGAAFQFHAEVPLVQSEVAEDNDLMFAVGMIPVAMRNKTVELSLGSFIGKVCFSLCARHTGRSLWSVIDETWSGIVSKRDWKANNHTGVVQPELPCN